MQKNRGDSASVGEIIGAYPDEATARRELMNIYMALNTNQPVYELR